MKYVHFLEVVAKVFPFIGAENAHGEADQGPQMHGLPCVVPLVGQVVNLGVAVVAGSNGVLRPGCQNLLGLEFAVGPPLIRESGLEESTAAAATEVVGAVGMHVDEVLFPDHRFHDEPQVLRHRVAEGFSYQLAGILDGELDFPVLVPIGTDLEFALLDPLGIVLDDALDLEVIGNLEFFQSEPDCE